MKPLDPISRVTRLRLSISSYPLPAVLIALPFMATPVFAENEAWKQNFAACAGNSPYIDTLLATHNAEHRPLMRIGEMQAWAIEGAGGEPTLALTTNDGLTVVGKVYGPQGEDISAALLATVPSVQPSMAAISQAPQTLPSQAPITLPQSSPDPSMSAVLSNITRAVPAAPAPAPVAIPTPDMRDTPAVSSQHAQPETAPITASTAPTSDEQAGMNAIFQQAGDERIWFSAAAPKPDAPVVYMLADPECPHCQWTIDAMHTQISSGDIDLRIIFAPITGVPGFNSSLSILHSENVSQSFMAHMTSQTRGTQAISQMDTDTADRAVVQGIVDNINWMRTNRMPGVPFFLYMTDDGARFAFSELPTNILDVAKPL